VLPTTRAVGAREAFGQYLRLTMAPNSDLGVSRQLEGPTCCWVNDRYFSGSVTRYSHKQIRPLSPIPRVNTRSLSAMPREPVQVIAPNPAHLFQDVLSVQG
jgi:hypothetical protein